MEGDKISLIPPYTAALTDVFQFYKVLAKGPGQLQSQCTTLLSMLACLREIHEIMEEHRTSNDDEVTLLNLNAQCTAVLISAEDIFAKFKSRQTDLQGLADVHVQIEDQTNELFLALEGLRERCVGSVFICLHCFPSRELQSLLSLSLLSTCFKVVFLLLSDLSSLPSQLPLFSGI